ncbi:MAG: GNAT family N-acetyltransferase [Rhodanobacter sp.]|jgi:predicted N-acyltransferase|nr:GNAT family N-acetyltransferase [Rhodanobacter sp.]
MPARVVLRNLLEPRALVDHFLAHPPDDFRAGVTLSGTPAFFAHFDPLSIADDALRRIVTALPLYRAWRHRLRLRTCFIGTTVSEYALFPADVDADALVRDWLDHARKQPLLIVKDIPQESPLLDATSNAQARAIAAACERAGLLLLEGQALAWLPIDFTTVEEYLARLSSSRRKDIRRKLRSRAALDIQEIATGSAFFADAAMRDAFYALYLEVFAQSEIHFDRLSRAFLDAVLQDTDSGGIAFVYRHAGRIVGWNLCFVVGDKLIDKYVGFSYPAAREHNLYFVSWIHNLDYALRRHLSAYIAGWTDPEIKSYLGARFTFTRHAVRPRSLMLRMLLRRLAGNFESDRQWAEAKSADEIHVDTRRS